MKKFFVVTLVLVALLGIGDATCAMARATHCALSARSRLMLAQDSYKKQTKRGGADALVEVTDNEALHRLIASGATVTSIAGNIATVHLTNEDLQAFTTIKGVKSISLARRLTITNDSARILSNVDPIHNGETYAHIPYTGKGIIVGVIDTGVDFNHINLCDEQGRSRVIAAYMPCDSSGTSPVVGDYTLPGSHYNTPEQIATLTADNTTMSHGTHTIGTAAGSYRANGMHGVAPDASIVVCAMPDSMLTDVNVAHSVQYIMDVARRENKPVVINMSIGSEEGPHDGTSMLCKLFDELSGPGRICVVSAANNAQRAHVIDHTFTAQQDTVYSCITPYGNEKGWIPGFVTSWSQTDKPHKLSFTAVSKSSGAILWTWDVPMLDADVETVEVSASNNPSFAQYFADGKIVAANAVESCNGHYHTIAEVNVKPINEDITLGMKLIAPAGERVCTWAGSGLVFTRFGHGYMTSGLKSMSISDLATCDSAISVGAYCSRKYMPLADGSQLTNSRAVIGDIAYFSGYGPDLRGLARPDVTAPGFSLVSSVSRYDTVSTIAHAWRAPGVTVDGVEYLYGSQYGTSMSTPVVAGTIALWLQLNPHLGPAQVRDILKATSVRDAYVNAAPEKWGAGKLDATAGMNYIMQQASINDATMNPVKVAPNPCNGDFTVAGLNGQPALLLIHDLQGRVVATRQLQDDGHVSLSEILDDGLYILSLTQRNTRFTTKLIVKH